MAKYQPKHGKPKVPFTKRDGQGTRMAWAGSASFAWLAIVTPDYPGSRPMLDSKPWYAAALLVLMFIGGWLIGSFRAKRSKIAHNIGKQK